MKIGWLGWTGIAFGAFVVISAINRPQDSQDASKSEASEPPSQSSDADETHLDFNRPIFGKGNFAGHIYGCISPSDLADMTSEGMDAMDNGGVFETCHAIGEQIRLRVLERKSVYIDVVPYDIPIQSTAGQDLWVFDSDLKN